MQRRKVRPHLSPLTWQPLPAGQITQETVRAETEWHTIVVFNNLSKYAARLKKGDRVYVEGELRTKKYEKTVAGETLKLTSYEVLATQIDRVAEGSSSSDIPDEIMDPPPFRIEKLCKSCQS